MISLKEDDISVWMEAVSDVEKMPRNKHVEQVIKKSKKKSKDEDLTAPFNQKFFGRPILNTKSDIDKQTFKRFKKEQLGVEAILDLHGMTSNEAYAAVCRFIISAYKNGKRTVIIVTGKGLEHKEQDVFSLRGSLKQSVPQWLQSDELSTIILSVIHPSAKFGGDGALYILLRRNKEKSS